MSDRRRLTLLALGLALATTAGVLVYARLADSSGGSAEPGVHVGREVPNISGTTLDGTTFDLAALRGRPVVINFWGPSCVPCREEFPLLAQELAQHSADGLAVVGVLFLDDVPSAKAFATAYRATWPTVVDPAKVAATAYRVVARPQSYFVDRQGILRSIQVGQVTADDFARQYAAIAP